MRKMLNHAMDTKMLFHFDHGEEAVGVFGVKGNRAIVVVDRLDDVQIVE